MRLQVMRWIILALIVCLAVTGCGRKGKDGDQQDQLVEAGETNGMGDDHEDGVIPGFVDLELDEQDELDDAISDEVELTGNRWIDEFGFEVGETYTIYGETLIHENPDTVLSHHPVGMTRSGNRYIFVEIQDDMVKVKTPDISGWVSLWYFTEEAGNIVEVEPYEMIVISPISTSFYPGGETDYDVALNSGKVVQIYKQVGKWVSVRAQFGDYTNPIDMWVELSSLLHFEPDFANEGVLRLGGKVYNADGRVKEESSGFPVMIVGELDNMYEIGAHGGMTGYILKEDFVPNPFVEPVFMMKFAVNVGMAAEYIVESLGRDDVTLRYFDYQHAFEPEDETETVSFADMLQVQNGERQYVIELCLSYDGYEVLLKPSAELIERIETDPAFRVQVGERLGEALPVSHHLEIGVDMFR